MNAQKWKKSKQCDNQDMHCEDNTCSFDYVPELTYKYLRENPQEYVHCKLWYRNIVSKDNYVLNKCNVNKLKCKIQL